VATTRSCSITLALSSNPTGAQLAGVTTLTTTNGRARFSPRIDALGILYRLRATCTGLPDVVSVPFDVYASRLAVKTQPTGGVSGQSIGSFTIEIQDVTGRPDLNAQVDVTVSILSGPSGAQLTGTLTKTTQNGAVSFTDLRLDKMGSYRLQATTPSPEVLGASSNRFDVRGSVLAFLDQPVTVGSGQTLPSVRIALVDTLGTLDSSFSGTINVYSEGGCSASGSETAVGGVATFQRLIVYGPTTSCRLVASSYVLYSVTTKSNSFVVTPGAAEKLALSATFITAGRMLPIAPFTVRVTDGNGYAVPSPSYPVTVTITPTSTPPPNATLSGTTTRMTNDGFVVFDDLSVDLSGVYALSVSSPGLTSVGTTFVIAPWGSIGSPFSAFDVDPTNENIVYAMTGYNYAIQKSVDGTKSWSNVASSNSSGFGTLKIDPVTPSTVHALIGGQYQRTVNGGATWTTQTLSTGYLSSGALALCAASPSTLYAAIGSVFRSSDGGLTWTKLAFAPTATRVAAHPTDPQQLYVWGAGTGLFRSTDGGATWSYVNGLPSDFTSIIIYPTAPAHLLALAPSAIHESLDGGTTWTLRTALGGYPIADWVVFNPADPTTMYAALRSDATGRATFRSTDGGATWVRWSSGQIDLPPVIAKSNPLVMYSGTLKTVTGGEWPRAATTSSRSL